MLYKYDKNNLVFKTVKTRTYLKLVSIIAIVMIGTSWISYRKGVTESINGMNDTEKIVFLKEHDKFEQAKLVDMMKELNVKFPWIPMAQSMIETGHWKSNIFVENHNLFGMKEAKQRVTTCLGTQNNHAYYETWRESVYDYAFYQSRYLGDVRSENDYFEYLGASYAENGNYVQMIKKTIQDYKLKELFQ